MFTSAKNDRIILNALLTILNKNKKLSTHPHTGYASLNQLKDETGLSKPYIINRINSLIANGYLKKESDIADHGGYLTNFFTILKSIPFKHDTAARSVSSCGCIIYLGGERKWAQTRSQHPNLNLE